MLDTIVTPLGDYTAARAELAAFERLHAETLDMHREMSARVMRTEDMLKRWARENGNLENDAYYVIVTQKTRKWYDADRIIELAPYVREMPGVVTQTIDRAVVERFARAGAIDKAICEQAYHEEAMTPAVSIREKVPVA
jgi:hypothetical protein